MEILSPTKNQNFETENNKSESIKALIVRDAPEIIILQNIKRNMVNGKLELENLTSKQRSYIHQLAEKYNMKHFSTGNYNNRILTIEDKAHTYFTIDNSPIDKSSKNGFGYDFCFNKYNNILEENKEESKQEFTEENLLSCVIQKLVNDNKDKNEVKQNIDKIKEQEESDEDYNEESDEESYEESDEES